VVDGIGHGGRDSDQPNLAYPFCPDRRAPIGFANEDDVEFGYIGVHGDEIVAEGCVRDSADVPKALMKTADTAA
jgi:hypothetical protein